MDKTESKYRDIQFYSEKNKSLMLVHSKDAKMHPAIGPGFYGRGLKAGDTSGMLRDSLGFGLLD